jgi:hypothetical protein
MIIVYKEQFAIIAVSIKQYAYKRQELGDNEVFEAKIKSNKFR